MSAADIAALGPEGWRARLREGHPIDVRAIEGWAYRGTSLGMPAIVDRLAWKTFQKAFARHPERGTVGWNVRLVQGRAPSARSEPMRDAAGTPITFGHFDVHEALGRGVPHRFDRGLLLDYGRGRRSLAPATRLRDPLVALRAGDAELLLGWSYLAIAGRTFDTPSFFVLEREHPIDHAPPLD